MFVISPLKRHMTPFILFKGGIYTEYGIMVTSAERKSNGSRRTSTVKGNEAEQRNLTRFMAPFFE